jgi:hypothetical protein
MQRDGWLARRTMSCLGSSCWRTSERQPSRRGRGDSDSPFFYFPLAVILGFYLWRKRFQSAPVELGRVRQISTAAYDLLSICQRAFARESSYGDQNPRVPSPFPRSASYDATGRTTAAEKLNRKNAGIPAQTNRQEVGGLHPSPIIKMIAIFKNFVNPVLTKNQPFWLEF